MKKLAKIMLLTLLVASMLLSTCGIALAETLGEVTVTEELVDESKGIYKLVFNLTTPDMDEVKKTHMVFSYDNTVIQPVNKDSRRNYADVAVPETTKTGSLLPLQAYKDDYTAFSIPAAYYVVNGSRTAISVDSFVTGEGAFTDLGFGILEFYYRYLDVDSANSETFKLETEYTDGSFLKFIAPDPTEKSASALYIEGSNDYTYGTAADDEETLAAPTFTYTGSDIPAGPAAPATYNVTVADYVNGVIKYDAETLEGLEADTVINFDITPYIGYALSSFKVNDEEMVASVVNGKFALTVAEDATIAATFEEIAVSDEEATTGKIYTAEKIYSVPADDTAENEKDRGASQITFGKAVAVEGKVPHTMGVYVEYKNGDAWADLKTKGTGFGPKFGALNPINNQFGIRIFGMDAGTYRVKTYVEYKDALTGEIGAPVYGNPVEFTVE